MGILRNALSCTTYTCKSTVLSVCPIPLYHGTVWVSLEMYYIYIYVHYPECLSHPVVPWDNMGILRNVLTCTTYTCVQSVCPIPLYHGTVWVSLGRYYIYIYVHCPECLSHPLVPWDSMGILRNALTCTTYTCKSTVLSVCPIPLYHGTVWVSLGMYYIYIYVHCPECLSHPVVPWDNMGILRNALTCTCKSTVQGVCPIPLYHGTIWVSLECTTYTCKSTVQSVSYPVLLWASLGMYNVQSASYSVVQLCAP